MQKNHLAMTWLHQILRLSLALIFVYASVDKILHPADFSIIIRQYHILPPHLTNLVAIFLPWLELLLGILLIAGVWLEGAMCLANLLLMSFWAVLIFNLYRGVDIHCGCFSTTPDPSANMLWYVARDGLFVLMGIGLAVTHWKTSKSIIYRDESC